MKLCSCLLVSTENPRGKSGRLMGICSEEFGIKAKDLSGFVDCSRLLGLKVTPLSSVWIV